jgi:hypothetical protein
MVRAVSAIAMFSAANSRGPVVNSPFNDYLAMLLGDGIDPNNRDAHFFQGEFSTAPAASMKPSCI